GGGQPAAGPGGAGAAGGGCLGDAGGGAGQHQRPHHHARREGRRPHPRAAPAHGPDDRRRQAEVSTTWSALSWCAKVNDHIVSETASATDGPTLVAWAVPGGAD